MHSCICSRLQARESEQEAAVQAPALVPEWEQQRDRGLAVVPEAAQQVELASALDSRQLVTSSG